MRNNYMKSAQVFSQTYSFLFFSCHQRPIIYQFMKIWAGGVQLPLPFQLSQGRPFYSFTGTNSPMWFIFICVNDTDFFIISLLFSSYYFLHATSAAVSGAGVCVIFLEVLRELIQKWNIITLYSCISKATFTCCFVPVFCFPVTQRFR